MYHERYKKKGEFSYTTAIMQFNDDDLGFRLETPRHKFFPKSTNNDY